MKTITLARKPLVGTVANNVLKYGSGGLNIDASRIGTGGEVLSCSRADPYHAADGTQRTWNPTSTRGIDRTQHQYGRFPANLILVDRPSVISQFPKDSLGCKPHRIVGKGSYEGWGTITKKDEHFGYEDGDNTCASRYFFKVEE